MKLIESFKSLRIFKVYYFAFGFYALPFISLGLFIIDQFTFNKTDMLFWLLFLIGMIPCGFIGLTLSIIGLIKSFKREDKINKVIGLVATIGGIICLIGGVFGFMLIYLVVA